MRKLLLLFTIVLGFLTSEAQNKNIQLLGLYPYTSPTLHGELSDVWGYVDSLGNEYALVGLEKGFSIVDVTDPQNLTEVFYVSGPSSIWRDVKTWDKHAYITNETSGGLMIVDMSALPGPVLSSDVSYYFGNTYSFTTGHNYYIDENGIGYLFGSDYGQGGAIMHDLTNNPKMPVEVGALDSIYFHDGMARGDTLWGAAVYEKQFFIVDVSNKSNPVILQSHFTSGQFTHNCWISDDGNTLFTTDEISNGAIGAYDVSDISNIDELDIIRSNPGSLVIPHNTHVYGNFLVTSYYRDGVTVVDATKPERLIQVGNYDTSPSLSGNGFNGAWGAYPYLPSEKLLVSDSELGLYVLGVDYVQGVYLQGNTRKFSDSTKIASTQITCLNTNESITSNLNGFYKESYADSGWYSFVFYKPGYLPDTIDIYMQSGMTYNLDVYLRNQSTFKLKGVVVDDGSKNPLAQSNVLLIGKDLKYETQCDATGYFEIDSVFEGYYEIDAGKWKEYKTSCQNLSILDGDSLILPVMKEIREDFTFDNAWTTSGNATNGMWNRSHLVFEASFNTLDFPIEDVSNDCSDFAFVTGAFDLGDHDVDRGFSILTSPSIDASSFDVAMLHFAYWFKNDAASNADDTLQVDLISGNDTVTLMKVYNAINLFQSKWIDTSIIIGELDLDLSSFKLLFKAEDSGADDLLEVGIDNISFSEAYVGIDQSTSKHNDLKLYPNPFKSEFYVEFNADERAVSYELIDLSGKLIKHGLINSNGRTKISTTGIDNGLYLLKVTFEDGSSRMNKVLKQGL